LLKACRLIKSLKIDGKEDLSEGCHTASTEPYYHRRRKILKVGGAEDMTAREKFQARLELRKSVL